MRTVAGVRPEGVDCERDEFYVPIIDPILSSDEDIRLMHKLVRKSHHKGKPNGKPLDKLSPEEREKEATMRAKLKALATLETVHPDKPVEPRYVKPRLLFDRNSPSKGAAKPRGQRPQGYVCRTFTGSKREK
jgi:hypothetical protein